MFIRWTFAFGLEKDSLAVEVRNESEDKRISDSMDSSLDWLPVPAVGKDAFINLRMCKAIIREEVNEEAQPTQTNESAQKISPNPENSDQPIGTPNDQIGSV